MKYEEKYKAALDWIRSIYPTMQGAEKEDAEHYFPELHESEDERIRKDIIRCLKYSGIQPDRPINPHVRTTMKDAFAWLEKQGEQKPTDKVESKFKVGDWITNGEYTWKVTDIKPLDYILQSQNGDTVDDTISYVDEEFHIWTIQDAKDGDVLVFDDIIMIFKKIKTVCTANTYILYCDGDGIVVDDWCDFGNDAHPATKEQRDTLERAMTNAGYRWNKEELKLEKI